MEPPVPSAIKVRLTSTLMVPTMLTAAIAASPTEETMEEDSTPMIMMLKESMISVMSMPAS